MRREFLGTSTITIVVTTATLLVVRWLGVSFRRQDDPGQSARPESEGLQFSIRGLMIFTAAVAVICAVARALEGYRNPILFIAVWAVCFVAVGLVSLWAVLGEARPVQRVPVAFVLSPVLGAFFAFAAGVHPTGWIYVLLIMLLYPAALLGSLLVVRSCGYRLVRGLCPPQVARDLLGPTIRRPPMLLRTESPRWTGPDSSGTGGTVVPPRPRPPRRF